MTERHDGASDFGFSLLAKAFHAHWRSEGSDVEVLTDYIAQNPPWVAESILLDTLQLVAADLPVWQIEAIWSMATHPFHDLRREGHDGRDWLHRIIRLSQDRLRTQEGATEEGAPLTPYAALTGAVLDEILAVSVGITEGALKWPSLYVPGIVPALNDVATRVCPDLAFRLMLRALSKFVPRVSREQYDRYVALGQRSEYGELLVSGYDHLTA
ncbi:hypothetical protein ACFVYP_39255 [Kitasatospora sp. NPDC058201]|uniref:hypothetical protein n=1 Tax=unclassified Kitasatospora TaxID=2633591 RepID=UPI003660FDAC